MQLDLGSLIPSSLMWLLVDLSSLLVVDRRLQLLAMWTSCYDCLQHGSQYVFPKAGSLKERDKMSNSIQNRKSKILLVNLRMTKYRLLVTKTNPGTTLHKNVNIRKQVSSGVNLEIV